MAKSKKQRLEDAGFRRTTVQEFLGLSETEIRYIELKVALAKAVKRRRVEELKISQQKFAERIGSSQSRVAKIEAGDPSVSMDLLMRSLVYTGSTAKEIGEVISSRRKGSIAK
jgi:DNA-binding transcriptional regulator YiaG